MKINNIIISSVFNFFDIPIRFIYCRLGFVSRLINKMMFWKIYSSDFKELDAKFENMNRFLLKNNINLKDKVILELGPGNSYINAYNFLLRGAKKVILVDKYPRNKFTKKQKEFSKKEIQFIRYKHPNKELFFLDGYNLKSDYIDFVSKDLTEINDLKVDFIYSISVMEHVKDVGGNIKKMANMLNRNGYMFHHIDMRDHYNFSNPFLFYKYSDYVWNHLLTKEGVSYTNRLRYDDFVQEFIKNKFIISEEKTTKYNLREVRINKHFKKYQNLDIGMLNILLKKIN